mgnify:CR=1 FL=1|tara:strand:- start:422 stop:979 length:558 start_codon:yes stop_codon:yes gene_type:complete
MEILRVIKSRRSVMPQQFNEKVIEKEQLDKILDAANWAPTHKKTEPWRFKVFSGVSKEDLGIFLASKYKETAENFSNFKYKKIISKFNQSSVVIAICIQRDLNESVPEWEEIASVAMAVQNMWLYSSSIGIGGYWSSPKLINYLSEHIELEKGERCLGFFYMGYFSNIISQRSPGSIQEKIKFFK